MWFLILVRRLHYFPSGTLCRIVSYDSYSMVVEIVDRGWTVEIRDPRIWVKQFGLPVKL